MREQLTPLYELRQTIIDVGGKDLKLCYQCGTCSATCPWNLVLRFLVRKMIHQVQVGIVEESDEVWICSTCKACQVKCPRGVKIIDIVKAIRNLLAEGGGIPKSLIGVLSSIQGQGNPWLNDRIKRYEFTKNITIDQFTKEKEFFYFICCTNCYDPTNTKVIKAQTEIFKKTEISFGIISNEESCCGEAIRKIGAENVYQDLAKKNIKLFLQNNVKKIITISPHCYHTFKNEYPEFGGKFEVIHTVELILNLIKQNKIKFSGQIKKKVTYHDPCYLGRHNDIYEQPRQILKSIPGIELVEMQNNKKNSLCCGGGAGGIWLERKKGERISDERIKQAFDTGAEIIVTACPYCITNFEDSIKTQGFENKIEVKEISELVSEAV